MKTYKYTVRDGALSPSGSHQTEWPSHTDVIIRGRKADAVHRRIESEVRSAAKDCGVYEKGDLIHVVFTLDDGERVYDYDIDDFNIFL